ncbi:hypothetical protein [Exiguobacterium alkaliphilum]
MNPVERLKEELELSADWNVTITVSRKDLEYLIRVYETLKKQNEENGEKA